MNAIEFNLNDCPICMDTFEGASNKVVTECGHAFHCSCLMQNISYNGFKCPYCRVIMADTKKDELGCWQDEDEEVSVISSVFADDVLATFRMFHQQLNGEEVEEEIEDEDEDDEDDISSDVTDEAEHFIMPDSAFVRQKLLERGITMEDLVKNILYQEHSNWGQNYDEYEHRSNEIFGQFRAVITGYIRHQRPRPIAGPRPPNEEIRLPVIAEAKPERIDDDDDYKYF